MAYDLNTIEPDYISSISGNFSSAATVKGQHVVTGLKEGQSINITPLGNGFFEISSPFIGTGGGSIFRVNNEPLYMDSGNFVGVSGIEIVRSGDEGILVANGIKFYADGNRLYAPALIDGSGTYINVNSNNVRVDFNSGYLNGHYATVSGLNATGLALIELMQVSAAGVSALNGQSGILNITGAGNIRSTFAGDTFYFSGKNPSVSSTSNHVSGRYQYCTQTGITGDHLIVGFTPNWSTTGILYPEDLTSYEGITLSITGRNDGANYAWYAHDSSYSFYVGTAYLGDALIMKLSSMEETQAIFIYYGNGQVWNNRYIYGSNDDSVWPSGWDSLDKWDNLFSENLSPRYVESETIVLSNTSEYKYYLISGTPSNANIRNIRLLSMIKSGVMTFDDIGGQNVGSGAGMFVSELNAILKFKSLTGSNGISISEQPDGATILINSDINTGSFVSAESTGIFATTAYVGDVSGALSQQIQGASSAVSSVGGLSGIIGIVGTGNISVTTGTPNALIISGNLSDVYVASGTLRDDLISTGTSLQQQFDNRKILRSYGWYNNTGAVQVTGFGPIFYIDTTQNLSGFRANSKTAPNYLVTMDVEVSYNYTAWASIFSTKPTIYSGAYRNNEGLSETGVFSVPYITGGWWARFNFLGGSGDGSGITAQLLSYY